MKMSSIIQFDICSIYTTIRYMPPQCILTRHVRSTINSSINALALLENSIFFLDGFENDSIWLSMVTWGDMAKIFIQLIASSRN